MYPGIQQYCAGLTSGFSAIPTERKQLLQKISDYIIAKRKENKPVNLIYICTHNSRRSHFGQIWAKVAAAYYGMEDVNTFSGGTEVTAFNSNAIRALERAGFTVKPMGRGKNPRYRVVYDDRRSSIIAFSKIYDDPANPQNAFAAIMTCSEAEANCPFISGADLRVATSYDDPKSFDNTLQQDAVYDERCRQIALETLYVFSKVSG